MEGTICIPSTREYAQLIDVWEASVRATHDFLKEEDIIYYKRLMPSYLPAVRLKGIRNSGGRIIAFIGLHEDKIEMLFIHPDERGKGLGRTLVSHAIERFHIRMVDVNEQNAQATGFYLRMGFHMTGRSETDDNGKPYPILHLELP